jgi:hypothetical protein
MAGSSSSEICIEADTSVLEGKLDGTSIAEYYVRAIITMNHLHLPFQWFALEVRVSPSLRHEVKPEIAVGFLTPVAFSVKASAHGGFSRGASHD